MLSNLKVCVSKKGVSWKLPETYPARKIRHATRHHDSDDLPGREESGIVPHSTQSMRDIMNRREICYKVYRCAPSFPSYPRFAEAWRWAPKVVAQKWKQKDHYAVLIFLLYSWPANRLRGLQMTALWQNCTERRLRRILGPSTTASDADILFLLLLIFIFLLCLSVSGTVYPLFILPTTTIVLLCEDHTLVHPKEECHNFILFFL